MPTPKILVILFLCLVCAGCAPGPATRVAAGGPAVYAGGETEPLIEAGNFAPIAGGDFIMGDIYGTDRYARPAHKVSVPGFFLAKHEVTFAQYDRFCNDTNRPHPDDEGWGRDDRPVINVTHRDAVAYTQWLSRRTGKSVRLPTEAEWEYAARGGRSTSYWWGNAVGSGNANCRSCGSAWDRTMTAPVGSFMPGPNGLHDMHGNVYEWVADSWHVDYTGAPADGSAWVDKGATVFVSRGGSFLEIPSSLQVFARNWSDGDEPRSDIGFRLAMDTPAN